MFLSHSRKMRLINKNETNFCVCFGNYSFLIPWNVLHHKSLSMSFEIFFHDLTVHYMRRIAQLHIKSSVEVVFMGKHEDEMEMQSAVDLETNIQLRHEILSLLNVCGRLVHIWFEFFHFARIFQEYDPHSLLMRVALYTFALLVTHLLSVRFTSLVPFCYCKLYFPCQHCNCFSKFASLSCRMVVETTSLLPNKWLWYATPSAEWPQIICASNT